MKRKTHRPVQIVKMLRQADADIAGGLTVEQVCRKLQISEGTYYKWRKAYGQMNLAQAKRLKELEKQNLRLKKVVAELSLDNSVLKETLAGKF